MINYNQMQGQPGMMGANPMSYAPNMYYSPMSAMMGGHSATGMNPSLPQKRHSQSMQRQIDLQMQNSIYGTGPGSDRRVDSMIDSMHGVMPPEMIAAAKTPGEGRNFAMGIVNSQPFVNRMFGGGGNSAHVAMGARSMIDNSANLGGANFDMYGSNRGRTTAAAQLTRNIMQGVQGENGGVKAEYGGSFENVGFAMEQLASGGSMQNIMSMNKNGKVGIDKAQSNKIKQYIKETTDTLEVLSDITGILDNGQLSKIAGSMTGLDPTQVQNATRIKEMVGKQVAAAEMLGYTPDAYIGMQQAGAQTLAHMGVPERAAGLWSARAMTGSAMENKRQQAEASQHGVQAMTTSEIHQRRMRSLSGMLGQGEAGTAGNLIVGINQALNMNKRADDTMMKEEDVKKYRQALETGDMTQLQRAAADIGNKYDFDISAQGRYASMNDRMRQFSVEEQAGIQDQLFAAQRGVNRKKYWNKVIVGRYGLSQMGGFTGTEGRERLGQLGDLFSQYGGEMLNKTMGMSEADAAQELAKDPATIAEAKRKGMKVIDLAREKAAQIQGITSNVDNVGKLRGSMSSAQDFAELDIHSAGSESDHIRGMEADKRADAIAKRRAKIKTATDRRFTQSEGGIADLTAGLISGDSNIRGTLSGMGVEGLNELGGHLDKSRADIEAKISAEADRLIKGDPDEYKDKDGNIDREKAIQDAMGTGEGSLGGELKKLDAAQQRLGQLKEEKEQGVQPVRVVGDFRLVDDQGNTVTLQSANQN